MTMITRSMARGVTPPHQVFPLTAKICPPIKRPGALSLSDRARIKREVEEEEEEEE